MSQTNLHEVAIGYLLAHQAEHLQHDRPLLLLRCGDHLQNQHDLSTEAAQLVTLKAIGEIEARGNGVHVDLTHTTSFAVFLVDPVTKARIVFTAAQLLRLAREQLAATVTTH